MWVLTTIVAQEKLFLKIIHIHVHPDVQEVLRLTCQPLNKLLHDFEYKNGLVYTSSIHSPGFNLRHCHTQSRLQYILRNLICVIMDNDEYISIVP